MWPHHKRPKIDHCECGQKTGLVPCFRTWKYRVKRDISCVMELVQNLLFAIRILLLNDFRSFVILLQLAVVFFFWVEESSPLWDIFLKAILFYNFLSLQPTPPKKLLWGFPFTKIIYILLITWSKIKICIFWYTSGVRR